MSSIENSEEENGNPLQYSCQENPMDKGAWQVTVHGVTKSRTQLKRLSMHACIENRLVVAQGGRGWQMDGVGGGG